MWGTLVLKGLRRLEARRRRKRPLRGQAWCPSPPPRSSPLPGALMEPSGIFQRDVLEVSGLLSSASAYLHFPIFGPHTRPLPSLEDRTHTYTHRHTSLCLRGILDLPSGDSSPLPHFPRLRLLRLTNLWLFQSLKGLETTSHTPCVPCLTPEPLPSYPKQSSCLWQQGRWLCLVHASSLSIHEMNEGLLSSIKPGSFPLLHTEHLPDAGGRCAGF